MPKRAQQPDLNQIASKIVHVSTESYSQPVNTKNQAAVMLGRLGGLKGGKARARALSPRQRKMIAKKAAQLRWQRAKKNSG